VGARKHPDVPGCVVRLTDGAVADLTALRKIDPQIVRWAFKKMIHLEQDPRAGDALLGGLVGYRKITVGDRDWRVVWRVAEDQSGGLLVEVAEVWAIGYRKEGEVYAEVSRRVAAAGKSPATRALTEVLELFAKQARDLSAMPEPTEPEALPKWLTQALVHVVGLRQDQVESMTLAEAEQAWAEYTSGPGS
jgi:mRNA interferase RelE/StbE